MGRKEQNQPIRRWVQWLADEQGASATEYGILMSFIVMLTMAAAILLGLELQGWFDELTAHFNLMWGIP